MRMVDGHVDFSPRAMGQRGPILLLPLLSTQALRIAREICTHVQVNWPSTGQIAHNNGEASPWG